ncbi:1049_t:CDS:2, partial [Gigaspora rosea]
LISLLELSLVPNWVSAVYFIFQIYLLNRRLNRRWCLIVLIPCISSDRS